MTSNVKLGGTTCFQVLHPNLHCTSSFALASCFGAGVNRDLSHDLRKVTLSGGNFERSRNLRRSFPGFWSEHNGRDHVLQILRTSVWHAQLQLLRSHSIHWSSLEYGVLMLSEFCLRKVATLWWNRCLNCGGQTANGKRSEEMFQRLHFWNYCLVR